MKVQCIRHYVWVEYSKKTKPCWRTLTCSLLYKYPHASFLASSVVADGERGKQSSERFVLSSQQHRAHALSFTSSHPPQCSAGGGGGGKRRDSVSVFSRMNTLYCQTHLLHNGLHYGELMAVVDFNLVTFIPIQTIQNSNGNLFNFHLSFHPTWSHTRALLVLHTHPDRAPICFFAVNLNL